MRKVLDSLTQMKDSYLSGFLIHGIFNPQLDCLYSSLTTLARVTASQVCRRLCGRLPSKRLGHAMCLKKIKSIYQV